MLDEWITSSASYSLLDDIANTSPHKALLLSIECSLQCSDICAPAPIPKWNWKKADLTKYKESLAQLLASDNIASADIAAEHLISSLWLASELAVPQVKQKKKKATWSSDIQTLMREGRFCNRKWQRNGRPPVPHPLAKERIAFKQQLRKVQRRENAIRREALFRDITSASSNDKKLFFSLIRKQRASISSSTKELILDDITYTEDLPKIWAMHFSRLATPPNDPHFDESYSKQVQVDVLNIESICKNDLQPLCIPITCAEVNEAICKLKLNKACDEFNLAAEHLRHAKEEIVPFLTAVINLITNTGKMPDVLKGGLLHPLPKKDKTRNIPTNYRGITITALIGKIVDYFHLLHQKAAIDNKHKSQFGFIEKRSCTGAALLVSEAIYESRDSRKPLYLAVLDVAKAFDRVSHPSLLRKMYQYGLRDNWWLLKQDMMRGMYSRVIWQHELSNKFPVLVGNRQGAYASPNEYLTYQLDQLNQFDDAKCGTYIGSIHIPSPTCADDTILMSDHVVDLQSQLLIASNYANRERYQLNPTKTSIVVMNIPDEFNSALKTIQPWCINEDKIDVEDRFTHLGIQRSNTRGAVDLTIEARITSSRRTSYALMGTGFYGHNGLPPLINLHIYQIFILSRCTYGLETMKLLTRDFHALEIQHRCIIRHILYLPDRTAISALHILSSTLPIQAQIEMKTLTFFRSCLAEVGLIQDVILRQHAMKDPNSNSWVVYVEKMLRKYNLPPISEIFLDSPSKEAWKKAVKSHIQHHWCKKISADAESKTTLQFLNPSPNFNEPHHAIADLNNTAMVQCANTKWRMMTGVYTLQATRANIFKQNISPVCLLCVSGEDETLIHFIFDCPSVALARCRERYLPDIRSLVPSVFTHRPTVLNDKTLMLHLILDATHPRIQELMPFQVSSIKFLEKKTQMFLNALHSIRIRLLNEC